jgi:predicted transcriptional regulator
MRTQKQAPFLKKRMIDKRVTVTDLAKKVGHARTTVSRAINHGQNLGVLIKVKEALDV